MTEAGDPTAATEQEINGPSSPASQFQIDRAIKIPNCTATRISSHYILTALHCLTTNVQSPLVRGSNANTYLNSLGFVTPATATINNIFTRPGTNANNCDNGDLGVGGCSESDGQYSDIAILQLDRDIGTGAPATMAWRYPGDGYTGQKVGAGAHDGVSNPTGTLLQVSDQTADTDDSNGRFHTDHIRVDKGDSGGPFYYQNRLLGTLTGSDWFDGLHTSVPRHLDWILSTIGYYWAGTPPQPNIAYNGTNLETFQSSERVCEYACEQTASCQAYNYFNTSNACNLLTNVSGTTNLTGMSSALHYGASSGRTNDVVGYVRSDGFSAVVHRTISGDVDEFTPSVGNLSKQNIPFAPAVAGKLSAYRRADGTNAVVYRSTSNRIIELSLGSTGWTSADLTSFGGPSAVGDPVAYVRADHVSAVVYRATNGHIIELRLATVASRPVPATLVTWVATDLTVSVTADGSSPIIATSDPSAYVRSDGTSSIVFLAGTQIFELFQATGKPWDWGEPSVFANAPAAASKPFGYTHHDGINAIVYRSTANRIIELWLDGAGWHQGDITSGGPLASGDPSAYVRTTATESVLYRALTERGSSEIVELTNTPWTSWNLSSFGGAAPVGDPSPYIRKDGANSVVFATSGNHASELAFHIGDSSWLARDLSVAAGELQ